MKFIQDFSLFKDAPIIEEAIGQLRHALDLHGKLTAIREFSDGFSGTRVILARHSESPDDFEPALLVFKIGDRNQLQNEVLRYVEFKKSIRSPGVFAELIKPQQTLEYLKIKNPFVAIVYRDAAGQLAEKECESLDSLCQKYVEDGKFGYRQITQAISTVFQALKLLYGQPKPGYPESLHLYYLNRWPSSFKTHIERLVSLPGETETLLLTMNGNNENYFLSDGLEKTNSSILPKLADSPEGSASFPLILKTLYIEGISKERLLLHPVHGPRYSISIAISNLPGEQKEYLKRLAIEPEKKVALWSMSSENRFKFFRDRIATAMPEIDLSSQSFYFFGRHLWNPLFKLSEIFGSVPVDRSLFTGPSQGDLHPGNVLVVGQAPVIIDFGLAETDVPIGVDAGRLIGGIIRNSIAQILSDHELNDVLSNLFSPCPKSGTDRVSRSRRILCHAVAKAKATSKDLDATLPLHLFGFAWIGIKWDGGGKQAHRACFLLAAFMANHILGPPPQKKIESSIASILHARITSQQLQSLSIGNPPYRDLQPFFQEHQQYFFGRTEQTRELVALVESKPIVFILGPSGCGKSSLMFAGLLPIFVGREDWCVLGSFRPQNRPFHSLLYTCLEAIEPGLTPDETNIRIQQLIRKIKSRQSSLYELLEDVLVRSPASRLLLTIDQFEEVFTQGWSIEETNWFFDVLLSPFVAPAENRRFTLVVTMRADFLDQALNFPILSRALQTSDIKLGPMSPQQLTEAIEEPARKRGGELEAGLTKRIISDLGNQTGNLPLLEFAMTLLWQRRQPDGNMLTHTAYDAIGGVIEALARYAENVFQQLDIDEQTVAKAVFLEMLSTSEGGGTKRKVSESETTPERWCMIEKFTSYRLVVTDFDPVRQERVAEIAHEALVRRWPRFQKWVQDEASFLQWWRRFQIFFQQWIYSKKHNEALLRGPILTETGEWLKKRPEFLSKTHIEFYRMSMENITNEKNHQINLEKLHIEARESSRLKSEFLASMSHQLRTPLNSVIGMIDLLLGTNLNDEQEEFAEIIKDSAESLLYIINNLLDFSRIEARKISIQNAPFLLEKIVESSAQAVSTQARGKGLSLMVYINSNIPPVLVGDSGYLQQILTNLIDNAVKFTETGEVVVRVEAVVDDGINVDVIFSVHDTGIGINIKGSTDFFKPYIQVNTVTSRKYSGTGLGLAICKGLVDMMGGAIGYDHRKEGGAIFWFRVTFKHPDDNDKKAHLWSVETPLLGTRVLLAMERESDLEIFAHYLESFGMVVHGIRGGKNAVSFLRNTSQNNEYFRFMIVSEELSDLNSIALPGILSMDEVRSDLQLIALLSKTDDKKLFLNAGYAHCLHKPILKGELFVQLGQLLNSRDEIIFNLPSQTKHKRQDLTESIASDVNRGRKLILCVEDNPVNSRLMRLQLSKLGYLSHSVSNGQEALDALKKHNYDLILMDMQMPVMCGDEAAIAIRESEKNTSTHIPIIAYTANAMKGDRERCLDAGMDDYLAKPVSPQDLLAKLTYWLGVDSIEQDFIEQGVFPVCPSQGPDRDLQRVVKENDGPKALPCLDLRQTENAPVDSINSNLIQNRLTNVLIEQLCNKFVPPADVSENTDIIHVSRFLVDLLSITGGDDELFAELCKHYYDIIEELIPWFGRMIADKSFDQFTERLDTLKGIIRSFGYSKLYLIVTDLQGYCERNEIEKAVFKHKEFQDECEKFKRCFMEILKYLNVAQ